MTTSNLSGLKRGSGDSAPAAAPPARKSAITDLEKNATDGGVLGESLPEWQKPVPKEGKCPDCIGVACLPVCGGVWHVEQQGLLHVDSQESHFPYMNAFAAAIYALASTVATMYVTVVELVTTRMDSAQESASMLEFYAWLYTLIYPLFIMIIVNVLCLETMAREYLFYAFLRNGILLDLEDAHTNILSWEYWSPRTASAGVFPHMTILSTVVLGLVTRAWSASLFIVCMQCVTLILFFNNTMSLKSRLVSMSDFVHKTIVDRTAGTQAVITAIDTKRIDLTKKGIDIDGDGTVDFTCFFATEDHVLETNRSSELLALDAEHDAAVAAHRAATAAAMAEVSAILARMECVTEADVRADNASIKSVLAHLKEAKKKKKITKEEYDARVPTLRYCFGERDPATGLRMPTLGLMARQPAAQSAGLSVSRCVANVMYFGVPNKLWALGVVSGRKKRYAGTAAQTHARFGKRLMVWFWCAGFLVICIELYGLIKGAKVSTGTASCEKETVAMCRAKVCFEAVCNNDEDKVLDAIIGHR